MLLITAAVAVYVCEAYALVGVLFALFALSVGARTLDAGLADASIALRLLLLPGVAAFWPVLAHRWVIGAHAPIERNPHRDRVGPL